MKLLKSVLTYRYDGYTLFARLELFLCFVGNGIKNYILILSSMHLNKCKCAHFYVIFFNHRNLLPIIIEEVYAVIYVMCDD